jgi:hypothetical protein
VCVIYAIGFVHILRNSYFDFTSLSINRYDDLWQWSIDNICEFWGEVCFLFLQFFLVCVMRVRARWGRGVIF